jgi:hypothetical protein
MLPLRTFKKVPILKKVTVQFTNDSRSKKRRKIMYDLNSVVDPHKFDSDSDPACHFDADSDLDPTFTFMRIWIRIQAFK